MKKVLRDKYQKLRREVKGPLRIDISERISRKLMDSPRLKEAERIMFYYPLSDEPDIRSVIRKSLSDSKEVFLPALSGERIIPLPLTDMDKLRKGSMGVMEPDISLDEGVAPQNIQLVVIPGTAFTEDGKRLGRGGGYYDRFLKESGAYSIGVAYAGQICGSIPEEEHDMQVDEVITEMYREEIKKC